LATKRKRYLMEQIVVALKPAEVGMRVDLVCQPRISGQAYCNCRTKNALLKKPVAELSLDKAILQNIATKKATPPALRCIAGITIKKRRTIKCRPAFPITAY